MHYDDYHEAWEMNPRKLSTEEIENPGKVIEDFFKVSHLPGMRSSLWELMKTMVTGTFSNLKSRERARLIYFYEQVEKLIEAAHVLHEKNKGLSPS